MSPDRRHLQVLPAPSSDEREASELTRRRFLGGLAASLGSASLIGCTRAPDRPIVPYRVQPEELIPGRPLHYATALTLDGHATGVVVEANEGKPTKIEGNPLHPASLGACGAYEQAALMDLYSPRRLRAAQREGLPVSGDSILDELALSADPSRSGRGIHLVLPPTSSPLLAAELVALRQRLPELALYFHAPVSRQSSWQAASDVFGRVLEPRLDLRRARVVLSLDADFLARGPGWLALARQMTDARRAPAQSMNRLYVVEGVPSATGDYADHRLPLRDRELPAFVARLLLAVGRKLVERVPRDLGVRLGGVAPLSPEAQRFLEVVVQDLLTARGRSAILVGERQPPSVHAAAHALNALLDDGAGPVRYGPSPILDAGAGRHDALAELRAALEANAVDELVVCEVDVAHASAADLGFDHLLGRAAHSTYLGLFENATARACRARLPGLHALEAWGDTRALDGTTTLVQPLLAPLYGGYDTLRVVQALGRARPDASYERLRAHWRAERPADFESFWTSALARGIIDDSALASVSPPEPRWGFVEQLALEAAAAPRALELMVRADPQLYDGRFADNPWLLELPSPTTKLTWGNALTLAPDTARELGVENGDVLLVSAQEASVEAPALICPGHAERSLGLTLGWGQSGALLGAGHGADAYALTSTRAAWSVSVQCKKAGRSEELAITQGNFEPGALKDEILASLSLLGAREGEAVLRKLRAAQPSLYTSDAPKAPRQWGMAIDLNVCTGCSACVIACQAENSVPTVGKVGVLKHREMHWLRVDRYLTRSERGLEVRLQPMACQHCEHAPCEYVCPTGATVHSSDGLNQMVYNRCVGTRYCSNNCPYKVRRFNWFDYHSGEQQPLELAHNPNVSVRERGVMEKCSYCVQRIRAHELGELRGEPLKPLLTACAQACPTNAIHFGDTRDPRSELAELQADPRAFSALATLGTLPRTRYLARVDNPSPELP